MSPHDNDSDYDSIDSEKQPLQLYTDYYTLITELVNQEGEVHITSILQCKPGIYLVSEALDGSIFYHI